MSGSPVRTRVALLATAAWACTAGLWAAGRPRLPPPPVLHPASLPAWWTNLGPVVAAFALARTGLLFLFASWALVLTALVVLSLPGALSRADPVWRRGLPRMERGGPPGRLLRLALGLSASGGLVGGCGLHGPSMPAASGAAGTATPRPPILVGPATEGVPEVVRLAGPSGGAEPGGEAQPATAGIGEKGPGGRGAAPGNSPAGKPGNGGGRTIRAKRATTTWTVRPGDDFWSIAEMVVSRSEPGAGTPAVARYWAELVALNRSRLPVPDNPDLLFPGDVLLLPAPRAGRD